MLEFLWDRLDREGVPEKLTLLMHKVISKSDYIDREELSASILKQFSIEPILKKWLKDLNEDLDDDDLGFVIEGDIGSVIAGSLTSVVRKIFDKSSNTEYLDDAYSKNGADMFRFVMRGLAPSIDVLTEETMSELDDDDVLVALMMDICKKGQQDHKLFKKQIKDTANQILKYPGRIMPFVKFNPHRKGAVEIVEEALKMGGCVGVKLYPTLQYKIGINGHQHRSKFRRLYQYCNDNDVPIIQHCNHGGFIANEDDKDYCDPSDWKEVLDHYPKLKVCFGHFGDEVNFVGQVGVKANSFTAKILKLMKTNKYKGRVFADLSFHVAQLDGGAAAEKNYFDNLKVWMGDADYSSQIMWGTDSFLVQKRMRERSYWEYYKSKFMATFGGVGELEKVSLTNSARFLNLPIGGNQAGLNIDRYVSFIDGKRSSVSGHAAMWLLEYVKLSNQDLTKHLRMYLKGWSELNPVHFRTWFHLKDKGVIPNGTFEEAGTYKIENFGFLRSTAISSNARSLRAASLASNLRKVLLDPESNPKLKMTVSKSKFKSEIRKYLLKKKGTVASLARKIQKYVEVV